MRIYFIAGAHGAGKSTLCQRIGSTLGIPAITAGELVRNVPDPSDPTAKRVGDIRGNQDRLIAALECRRSFESELLLDGHFCLLDRTGRVARIPIETFADIDPSAVVLVQVDPVELQQRLKSRDGTSHCLDVLEGLAVQEEIHAKVVCEALRRPLLIWNEGMGIEAVEQFVRANR